MDVYNTCVTAVAPVNDDYRPTLSRASPARTLVRRGYTLFPSGHRFYFYFFAPPLTAGVYSTPVTNV